MKKLIVLLLFPFFLFNCERPADSANRRALKSETTAIAAIDAAAT